MSPGSLANGVWPNISAAEVSSLTQLQGAEVPPHSRRQALSPWPLLLRLYNQEMSRLKRQMFDFLQ